VFDVERVLSRVQDERVTVLPGAPTIYQAILDHTERDHYDLSSLRVAVTGAADIPVELIRRVHDELPFRRVVTGYGLTEAGTASATEEGDDPEAIATTVGRPRPGFEVRVVGEGDRDLPAGEAGEVLLRGGSVMAGYLDDPEETEKVLSADGGFNAYPAEIENALLRHPDVQQAAVIGIPDERLGEVGMAFLVLADGAGVTPEGVIEWSRQQMANYKVPRAVEIVDELPLNATGKVVKETLREHAAAGRARDDGR